MSSTGGNTIPRFSPWFGTNFAEPLHSRVPASHEPESNPLGDSPFVVLITGASRGIGRSTAQVFARAGATALILTARTTAALEETKTACQEIVAARRGTRGLKITTVAVEAGLEADAQRLAGVVRAEHGRLDLLVNNVGIVSTDASAWEPFPSMSADQILLPMRVNYVGRFLTMQSLAPLLRESPGGAKTIINITSECSHFTNFGPLGFNVSELASNRLTEVAAAVCPDLLYFSVHPGMVPTTAPPGMPDDVFDMAEDSPELCGAFCLWLVREKPAWLSGRYLSAKWDIEELEKKREEIVQGDKLKVRMVV